MSFQDIQAGVTKAASFFAGPFAAFIAIGVLLDFVAGVEISALIPASLERLLGSPDSPSFRILSETELLKLAPLIALFLFLLVLVLLRNAIRTIAQILPPQAVLDKSVLMARLAAPRHTFALWKLHPELSVDEVMNAVEAIVEERLTKGSPTAASSVAYFRERAAAFMRAYDAFKCLSYFAVLCAAYRISTSHDALLAGGRLGGALAPLAGGAVVTLVMSMHYTYQAIARSIEVWAAPDEIWDGTNVATTAEKFAAFVALAHQRWWWIRLLKVESLSHYWNILRGGPLENEAEPAPTEANEAADGGQADQPTKTVTE